MTSGCGCSVDTTEFLNSMRILPSNVDAAMSISGVINLLQASRCAKGRKEKEGGDVGGRWFLDGRGGRGVGGGEVSSSGVACWSINAIDDPPHPPFLLFLQTRPSTTRARAARGAARREARGQKATSAARQAVGVVRHRRAGSCRPRPCRLCYPHMYCTSRRACALRSARLWKDGAGG